MAKNNEGRTHNVPDTEVNDPRTIAADRSKRLMPSVVEEMIEDSFEDPRSEHVQKHLGVTVDSKIYTSTR